MYKPGPARLAAIVQQFNRRYPVGTPVTRTDDFGIDHETKTRSEAWVMGGSAVVMVEGISGGYLLDRITPITE